MQPEIRATYSDIATLPRVVRALCEQHGIRLRPLSDLVAMLKHCTGLDGKVDDMPLAQRLVTVRAYRALATIADCAGVPGIKAPLERIASSPLDPASSTRSPGRDALFELEMLTYLRHRGLAASLAEPDIVIAMGFGDYHIACKTIASLNNLKGQLRSGYRQVEKRGHGCVALNLEPQLLLEQPLRAVSAREARSKLDASLRSLYGTSERLFEEKLTSRRLDGVILQVSAAALIEESASDLDQFTHTVFFSRRNRQDPVAHARFDGFRASMLGPLS